MSFPSISQPLDCPQRHGVSHRCSLQKVLGAFPVPRCAPSDTVLCPEITRDSSFKALTPINQSINQLIFKKNLPLRIPTQFLLHFSSVWLTTTFHVRQNCCSLRSFKLYVLIAWLSISPGPWVREDYTHFSPVGPSLGDSSLSSSSTWKWNPQQLQSVMFYDWHSHWALFRRLNSQWPKLAFQEIIAHTQFSILL